MLSTRGVRKAVLIAAGLTQQSCADTSPNRLREMGTPPVVLSGTPETVPESFSRIVAARELSDGRVLVLDGSEHRLVFTDFAQHRVTPVGRTGSGPSEYRFPRALLAYRGDSSILTEPARLISVQIVAGDGRIVPVTPGGRTRNPARIDFFRTAADTNGYLYTQVARRVAPPERFPIDADSAWIERINLQTGARDTVGAIRTTPMLPEGESPPARRPTANQPFRASVRPFATRDLWSVLPDGRVVVVSAIPYRIEIADASGTRVAGPRVAVDSVRVENAHKEHWRAEKRRPTAITVFDASGVHGQETELPFEEPETWPRFLPPFLDQPLRVGADGTLWIERTGMADAPVTVDVFDQTGERVSQVHLPKGRRLAGIGGTTLYLVRTDADDVQYLEKWPRPAPQK